MPRDKAILKEQLTQLSKKRTRRNAAEAVGQTL